MATLQINLDQASSKLVEDLAKANGSTPDRVVREAIVKFAAQCDIPVNEARRRAEWRRALDGIEGMWAERDDLPDFDAIRRSLDRDVWGERR